MVLIWGPPGSGKTHFVMAEVRSLLGSGARDFRLLVPTATMAEHLRNQLAREGFVFPPEMVSTLTRFLAGYAQDLHQAPAAALPLIIESVLDKGAPAAFSKVARFPGFASSLARLIEEFASAGCDAERVDIGGPIISGLMDVWREADVELRRRGWLMRGQMLARLASRIRSGGTLGIGQVFFDGFLSMTGPELEVVDALAAHSEVTLTLPDWSGAEAARQSLRKLGFREMILAERRRARAREVVVEARSLAAEADEVSRRILAEHAFGRPWREIGVILRSAGKYTAALTTAFERFGIPARFYFAETAANHEVIRFLDGVVEAMLSGWDHELLLGPLTMTVSGLSAAGEGDRLDLALRGRLPGRGFEALREIAAGPRAQRLIDALERLDSWRGEKRKPAEWATRATALRSLAAPSPPAEPFTHQTTLAARSTAAALDAYEAAVGEAAELMDRERAVPFNEFWLAVRASLCLASLRAPDRRRDVVHVIDVYEARQWELPVVFVCGLLEKEFPRYHSSESVLDDDARDLLARAGVRLRTSEDRQREEEFLFEIATSRATSLLTLTWPRYNEKGDENLRSFLLDEFAGREGVAVERAMAARPEPAGMARVLIPAPISDDELRAMVAQKHDVLAPTSIEAFLQCPFQFFASRTLALEPPPEAPEDRLGIPLQGQILHEVLAELVRNPQEPLALLAGVFERYCAQERIPDGYRREAVRLELERNLVLFLRATMVPDGWKAAVEQRFELNFPDLRIRGRIDRVQVDPATGRAIVVDYKYSNPDGVRKNVKAHEQGSLVQGGLYMLASEQCFGLKPAAMVYCGIKKEPSCQGWRCGVPELPKTVTDCLPDVFRAVIDQALERSLGAAAEIRAGEVAAAPTDTDKCRYCGFVDICRVESAPARVAAAEGAE